MSLLNRLRKKDKDTRPPNVKDEARRPQTGASPSDLRMTGEGAALEIGLLPHRSEKAMLAEKEGKYVFRVRPRVPKARIKEAVESSFGVHVVGVKVTSLPAKMRRRGRILGERSRRRKAIVTLRKGERIDLGI